MAGIAQRTAQNIQIPSFRVVGRRDVRKESVVRLVVLVTGYTLSHSKLLDVIGSHVLDRINVSCKPRDMLGRNTHSSITAISTERHVAQRACVVSASIPIMHLDFRFGLEDRRTSPAVQFWMFRDVMLGGE